MSRVNLPTTTARKLSDIDARGGYSFYLGSLLVLMLAHFVVDTVACVVTPLWPELEQHYGLRDGAVLWLFVLWTMTTSFSQLLFGYIGDRFRLISLIWVGPAVAVVCMSAIGLTTSPWVAALLLVVGGCGIASFHPEAAAVAGGCAPNQRSRAMSIFAIGGYLGQATGPSYSGAVSDSLSLSGLAWGIPVGIVILLVLGGWMRSMPRPPLAVQVGQRDASLNLLRQHAASVCMVLTIGTLRVLGAMGIPLALAWLLNARGSSNTEIGTAQSAFMVGIGVGGIICALWVGQRQERAVLGWVPIAAVPVMLLIPTSSGGAMLLSVGLSGLLVGVVLPVLISYGQQLLPQSQRIASSLTMGVSWGLGGALVAATLWIFKRWDTVETAFWVFAVASAVSGLLTRLLPRVDGARGEAAAA